MTRNFRIAGVHLALAAMLLRALLPVGWMPNAAAGSGSPLVICTMDGLVQIRLDANGHPIKDKPSQDDGRHHEVCPFAAAAHLAPSADAAPVLAAPAERSRVQHLAQSAAGDGTRFRSYSSRAPPLREA